MAMTALETSLNGCVIMDPKRSSRHFSTWHGAYGIGVAKEITLINYWLNWLKSREL